MRQPLRRPKTAKPWEFPQLAPAALFSATAAIKALEAGTADEHQQRLAWRFIREVLCGCESMSFWPGAEDGRRATDFAEGKRWVAGQLRRISRLVPGQVDIHGEPPAMPGQPSTTEVTDASA